MRILLPACLLLAASAAAGLHGADDTPPLIHAQAMSDAFADVTESVMPAVVSIRVTGNPVAQRGRGQSPFDYPELRRFLPPELHERFRFPQRPERQMPTPQGQGSGFVISEDGYILTNHHVIDRAQEISVQFQDGTVRPGKVVGSDPQSDVAVIKVEATGLATLPIGSSASMRIGEWVLAVGSPFGLNETVTAGIISAKGRSTGILGPSGFESFIQTDAAINPGNSGGPLVNLRGEVIGINSAIFSRSGGSMGIGFAIPMDMAMPIKDQLIETGSVTRGFLGVMIQPIDEALREALGLDGRDGILVAGVSDDTPAKQSGIEVGDVIVALDGQPVTAIDAFRNRVALQAPGTTVQLELIRDGAKRELSVTLGSYQQEGTVAAAGGDQASAAGFGLVLGPVDDAVAEALGAASAAEMPGAVILEVEADSPAAKAGMIPGMVIQRIGSTDIGSPQEATRLLDQAASGARLLVLVRDERGPRFLGLVAP